MNKSRTISEYAMRSLASTELKSVVKTYKGTIVKLSSVIDEGQRGYYVGIKDTNVITSSFIKKLEKNNFFVHTKDKASKGGRAIDLDLINPITGRYMTGSSSGSAINVFLNVNDIAIGTDGGGSVLAPSLALNLYGLISPLIEQDYLKKFRKESTDGVVFSPSIGFISKDINVIDCLFNSLYMGETKKKFKILYAPSNLDEHKLLKNALDKIDFKYEKISLLYSGLNRNKMIEELQTIDFQNNILITEEGPIDYFEYGDSVMGHYDDLCKLNQEKGHKYYLKVVNMLNLSAIIVPSKLHGRGFLIICDSNLSSINYAINIAKKIPFTRSKLENTYFDCLKDIKEDTL